MPARLDLTGQRFGRLTPLYRLPGSRWQCQCDCGKQKPVLVDSLRSGKSLSCGCLRRQLVSETKRARLVGNRFGRLVVTSPSGSSKHSKALWTCQCDCGAQCLVSSSDLRSGKTASCGCSKRVPKVKDEVGKRYGSLSVIRWWGTNARQRSKWLCLCKCGQQTVVVGDYLRSGETKSCGCLLREWASRLGKEVGRFNGCNDGIKAFMLDESLASSSCWLYFVEVCGTVDKIGISADPKARGRGAFTRFWYTRKMQRASAWCAEQIALKMTEDALPLPGDEAPALHGGLSELRQGLNIEETCELLDDLADNVEEVGWIQFAQDHNL